MDSYLKPIKMTVLKMAKLSQNLGLCFVDALELLFSKQNSANGGLFAVP